MKRLILPVVAACLAVGLQAHLSLIEFTAELLSTSGDGEAAILSVRVANTTLLDIHVNDLTEIRDGLEQKTVEDLLPGMILKIEAFHTSDGFTAREIEVTDVAAAIEVRGRVTEKTEDPAALTVAGLTFQLDENTKIRDFSTPPNRLEFADINIDDFVKIEATSSESGLLALMVRVGDPGERFARLAFEGVIASLDTDQQMMTVAVESVTDPLPVQWTDDTRFNGTPYVGAPVTVVGHLNSDLTVVADKVIVKQTLHLAPGKVKMKTNDSRNVQIILQDVRGQDLTLSIGVSPDSSAVEPSPAEVVIPAGQVSGFFTLTSGDTEEDATVTATSEGLSASAEVEVRDRGQGQGPATLAWSPPQLHLKSGQRRSVLLRLNQPATEEMTASLTLMSDIPGLLTDFEAEVTFMAGERQKQITVTAGPVGEGTLRALLSNGAESALTVGVR